MIDVIEVPVKRLTPGAFEPFGQLVGELPTTPAWARPRLTSWRLKFAMDGHPDLKMVRFHFQEMAFSRLERHFSHTETRIPLGGGQAVLAVAPSRQPIDRSAVPDPSEIRAFFIDGSAGIMLWKGTWHGLDCYPARPPHTDFGFISEVETQEEIEVPGQEGQAAPAAKLTQVVDYAERDAVGFRVVDPSGLLPKP